MVVLALIGALLTPHTAPTCVAGGGVYCWQPGQPPTPPPIHHIGWQDMRPIYREVTP